MTKLYQYKNSTLEKLNRGRRRMFAYIKQSQIRRIKIYIILALILSLNMGSVFASGAEKYYGDYYIRFKYDPYVYISYYDNPQPNFEYYYLDNTGKHCAYCLELGKIGAERGDYIVNGNNELLDTGARDIILNGYPYVSVDDLGLDSEDQAIFATQFALWCYRENLDLGAIKPMETAYTNVVDAINNIYNLKCRSSYDVKVDYECGEQKIENIDGVDYYTKIVKFKCENVDSYELHPQSENLIIEKQKKNKYKLCLPVEQVNNSKCKAEVCLNAVSSENIVLFGDTDLYDVQKVAVCVNPSFSTQIFEDFTFEDYSSEIKIIKRDKDSKEIMSNVKFKVLDEIGNEIGEFKTNEDGYFSLTIHNIDEKKIIIREIETKDGYKLLDEDIELIVKPSDNIEIELFNEKKKGTIEIVKKTKEYNKYTKLPENTPLKNVVFNIYNSDKKLVDTVKTNKYGYAKSKELPIGKYYIEEVKTNEYYELLDKLIEIEILEDKDNISVKILNKNVFIEEELPITGT